MDELLPDSRLKDREKGTVSILHPAVMNRLNWAPIFCANCGAAGGYVPQETTTFAFYLCNPCAEKWSALAGTMQVPDEVFWEKVRQAELEEYGHVLSTPEVIQALNDGDGALAKLAKEAPKGPQG
jgi:hypothetical protein